MKKFSCKCPNCGKRFRTYLAVYIHMKYWCKRTDNNLYIRDLEVQDEKES